MLSFFRVNASYQMISLVLWLILLRLPFLFVGVPLLIPELQWMLVGEKMGQGFLIYAEIWDNLSPLSSVVYWIVDKIFGRSQLAFQLIAMVVTLVQALYVNYMAQSRQFYTERNYVPGALYLLFMNMSFDCSTLSPSLMANTFLLLAFGTLTKQIGREKASDDVFEVGFYISLAMLLHMPMGVFILWILMVMLMFTGAGFRQVILALFGFLFPLILTYLIFFFRDASDALSQNLLRSLIQVRDFSGANLKSLALSVPIPLLISFLGFYKVFGTRFTNYQNRCQQIVIWWIVTGIFSTLLIPYVAPMQFIWYVFPMSFLATNFFLIWKKRKWLAEVVFVVVVAVMFSIQLFGLKSADNTPLAHLSNFRIKEQLLPDYIKNKRILVVGKHDGEYYQNLPTTCYLNWDLARFDLEGGNSYESIISIFDNFTTDPPQYIIDKRGVMPAIFKRLPELHKRYKPTERKNIYVKI